MGDTKIYLCKASLFALPSFLPSFFSSFPVSFLPCFLTSLEKERLHNEITKLFLRVGLRTLASAGNIPNFLRGSEVACTDTSHKYVQNII